MLPQGPTILVDGIEIPYPKWRQLSLTKTPSHIRIVPSWRPGVWSKRSHTGVWLIFRPGIGNHLQKR